MSSKIHPSACIHPSAEIGADVEIGPCAVIGPKVTVGDRSKLLPHCHIVTCTTIGKDCCISTSAVVGGDPQDMKYRGEETYLEIGDRTRVGEFTTINRGTGVGGGMTMVGKDAMIMAYVHIAHDCMLGDGVVITNGTQLAGHVKIEDQAWISGACLIHHFVTLGTMCFVAPGSRVRFDIPPYMIADGDNEHLRIRSLNIEGLRRRQVVEESVSALKEAYRVIYRRKLTQLEAINRISEKSISADPYVKNLVEHLEASHAGYQNRALERFRTDKTRHITREIFREQ